MIPFLHSLFGRFVLIIIVPIILLQAFTTYIFYQRHWDNVNKHMQFAVLAELKTIVLLCEKAHSASDRAKIFADWQYIFNAYETPKPLYLAPQQQDNQWLYLENITQDTLQKDVKLYYINEDKSICCDVDMGNFILSLEFTSKRIQSPTTYIFVLWVIGISTILAIIALLFMKNQLRSIINLAETADKLGKGQDVATFEPKGAKEIRMAGIAFIRMKRRIERQIKYRTELLNHISHDLRTPITRIKLQLALLDNQEAVNGLNANLNEMEHMLVQYLNFAKGEGNEHTQLVDVIAMLKESIHNFQNEKIHFNTNVDSLMVAIRLNAFKRVMNNLIDNAIKFSREKVLISFIRYSSELIISIEDDGNGIPEELHKKVFRPFYKHNHQQGGFGLGLAIVKSIVYAHGGRITLRKSQYQGLRVDITLPL